MPSEQVYMPEPLHEKFIEDIDYPDEMRSSWLREAVMIRLFIENDDELVDQAEEQLNGDLDLEA